MRCRYPHWGSLAHAAIRPQIRPTPAAAPSLNRNNEANHSLQGVLRVVFDQSNTNYYVKRPVPGPKCSLTKEANEALRVRCDSLPSATLLERIVSLNPFIEPSCSYGSAHLCDVGSFVPFLVGCAVVPLRSSDRRRVN